MHECHNCDLNACLIIIYAVYLFNLTVCTPHLLFVQRGNTAVMWAAYLGYIDVVKYLVGVCRADVNAVDKVWWCKYYAFA